MQSQTLTLLRFCSCPWFTRT